MLYPNIQRKSIGFLLIFSTFSLFAVGFTFLIFYKTTTTNSNQQLNQEKIIDNTIRINNNFNREIDTIYIDDYDKIIDDEKSIKKIDYFDEIIKDHQESNDDEKLINLNKKQLNDDYDDERVNSGSGDFINSDDDDQLMKIKQKSLNQDNFYSVSSEIISKNEQKNDFQRKDGVWLETRARRIIGNVKKSEERSRQLLLCEEAGGGELCRMLFKGVVSE